MLATSASCAACFRSFFLPLLIHSIASLLQGDAKSFASFGEGVKIDRLAGVLPYVSYEESMRLYNRVQRDLTSAIDVVASTRCDQPNFDCIDDERSYSTA